jgi:dUTP pyrophosphatase
VKIKKLHPDAIIPTKAHETDAGFDLYGHRTYTLLDYKPNYNPLIIETGIAIEFPVGKFGLIRERSSLALKGMKILGGIIDYGYNGEIKIIAYNFGSKSLRLEYGKAIAQLIILPFFSTKIEIVNELSESERGNKGFGSSDIMKTEIAKDFED